MAMGLNTNTPNYIWRAEAGVKSMEIETRRRAGGYMARVLEMEEKRWPKICLREEARNILNKTPTTWGNEIIEALGKGAAERVATKIWKEEETEEVIRLLDEENRKKAEKEMQEDKRRIEESEYWKYYKKWIPGIKGGEH